MAERFHPVTQKEMEAFLLPQGFVALKLERTYELVYGKFVKIENHPFSLRIYTALNPDGQSRQKGSDAIRVRLFAKKGDKIFPVGKRLNCLRVKNWAANITRAMDKVQTELVFCPKCEAPMVERESKTGAFMGCSQYHETGCNGKPGTPNAAPQKPAPKATVAPAATPTPIHAQRPEAPKPATVQTVREIVKPKHQTVQPQHRVMKYTIADDMISPEQAEVTRIFLSGNENIISESRAGGGKTSLLSHLAAFRRPGKKYVYLAFGSKNAKEGKKKLPPEVNSRTTHSFVGLILRELKIIAGEPTDDKNYVIMEDIYPAMDSDVRKQIRRAVFKMIGLAKNFGCVPGDRAAIRAVMDEYSFDLTEDDHYDMAIELTDEALALSMPKAKYGSMHNFDDWLWFAKVLQIPLPRVDVVLADEVQDFNACQIDLIRRLELQGTRIVAVGDPFQAVFRFRGADCDAFAKVEEMLNGSKWGCKKVLLPTNYRCSKRGIQYVCENTIVKDIVAHDGAPEGLVDEDMTYVQILDMLQEEFGQNTTHAA